VNYVDPFAPFDDDTYSLAPQYAQAPPNNDIASTYSQFRPAANSTSVEHTQPVYDQPPIILSDSGLFRCYSFHCTIVNYTERNTSTIMIADSSSSSAFSYANSSRHAEWNPVAISNLNCETGAMIRPSTVQSISTNAANVSTATTTSTVSDASIGLLLLFYIYVE
jgi:hypothetical protein